MQKITVPTPTKDNLTDQFISLYQVLLEIIKGNDITFEFSRSEKIYPLITLPLCALIRDKSYKYLLAKSSVLKSNGINFPHGTNKIKATEYQIPIIFLSNKPTAQARDQLIGDFVEKLYTFMTPVAGVKDAIFHPISELIANIFEHSHKDEGWAFAQLNSGKKCLDICIVDSGRGLRESYKQEKNFNISDADAIGQVMIGNSTKLYNERGYGVRSSKKLICQGLKGSFLIFSGKAALIAESRDEELIELDKAIWNGVVLAYRIPLLKEPINIYPYLE